MCFKIILISITEGKYIEGAKTDITLLMQERRAIKVGESDNFHIRDMEDLLSTMTSTTKMLTYLFGSIAAISLLVGGIGIMNIMYVSVTERTKEIGLRMSVGARSRDIMAQFLVEAIIISITGGLIGVLFGSGVSLIIRLASGWAVTVSPFSVILSFLFCTFTGVFFGWYPAKKAANLDPIEAIRYE